MKTVTLYQISGTERAVEGDWLRLRIEFPKAEPSIPWNNKESVTALHTFKDEMVQVVRVHKEGREDRYIAIEPQLAEWLVYALQPVSAKLLDSAHAERRLVERRLGQVAQDLAREGDRHKRTQERFSQYVERVNRFRNLPWYARMWCALRGDL